MKNKLAFLGGTCNGSQWREALIPLLKIDYFNPVVPNWDEAADKKEKEMRVSADFVLYTITPKMTGVYSIAEAVEDSNKRPATTVFVYLEEDEGVKFDTHQMKALKNTAKLIAANGGVVASSLQEVADILNAA